MSTSAPTLALLGSYREFPIPRHLVPATLLLIDLEYGTLAIDAALTYANRYGTFVGCAWADRKHRDALEATLPFSADYNDPAWNSDVWNAVDDDGDGDGDNAPVGSPELVGAY